MKLIGAISTAVLTLSLGVGIPAYAQQEQHDQQEETKDKPAQEKEQKAQPEKAMKPEEKNARPEERTAKPEAKTTQEQHTQEAKPAKQEQHASNNGGGRIPEASYKAHFGQEHHFRVSRAEYGNRRFQYGGYWFGFESAWPSNWLYTQDVYVVEIDGVYYLCNASYPGVNLMLSVTL
ncbi:MAG: hypothetical protein WBQ08_09050 [Candidatus Sulfotelmatobacter sp.]